MYLNISKIVFLSVLCFLAYQDYRKREVSLAVIIIWGVFGVIFRLTNGETQWLSVLAGAGIGGVFLLLSIVTKGKVGAGDAWILAVSGVYLEFWENLNMCILALYLAGVGALLWYWMKRCKRTDTMPFVPFLLAGYLILLWKHGG